MGKNKLRVRVGWEDTPPLLITMGKGDPSARIVPGGMHGKLGLGLVRETVKDCTPRLQIQKRLSNLV